MLRNRSEKMQRLACFAVVGMPLLQCYNLFGTGLTKFIMLGLVVYFLIFRTKTYQIPKKLSVFLCYAFTVPQITAILSGNTSEFIGSYLTIFLFCATYVCLAPYLDLRILMKYYRVIVYVAIGVFILQEVSNLLTGYRFGVLLPFLDLYSGVPASEYLGHYKTFERSCSIFVEPSHFAQYLAPYLALSLNENSRIGKFFGLESVIVSIVMLLIRSGNGYFLLATIWIVHFLICKISMLKKIAVILPISVFIVVYGYAYFINTEIGAEVMERTEQLDANYSGDHVSGTVRIYRGFWVHRTMGPLMKIFGVGLGGVNDVIDNSPLSWSFGDDHYVNNASAFMMAFGYIGCILLLCFLFSLCSKQKSGTIYIIAAFITLSLMESFSFDSRMLMYLLLPHMLSVSNNNDTGRGVYSN